MKKNIWIFIPTLLIILGCVTALKFLKPSENNPSKNTTASSTTEKTNDVNDNHESSQITKIKNENIENSNSHNLANNNDEKNNNVSTTMENPTDFNSIVYGEDSNRLSGNEHMQGSEDGSASQYFNPASDMHIKPIDPETDPANQLANSKKVKPLEPEPEIGNVPDFVKESLEQ